MHSGLHVIVGLTFPPPCTLPLRNFDVGYVQSKHPFGSHSMYPSLVAWGIFNFNDIMHASKVYPGKYRSRNSSAECLVVTVKEISVL